MAKRLAIPYKEIALKLVGARDVFLASRVQRLDMPTNIPTTDIDELGNPLHAGTTQDAPEVTATFQAMDVSVKIFSALTGTNPAAFPAAGVSITELGEVDLIGVIRDADVADYVKTVHLRRCQIESFTYTYALDGDSTEEYTAAGSKKRWFKNDVVVDVFATPTTPVALSETPVQLKNSDYCLTFRVDGEYFDEVAVAPGDEQYQVTGTSVAFDDSGSPARAVAVYQASPAGNNWSDVSDATIPAAIRGKDVVPVLLADDIERVQSVTIRGTFPSERIEEMGNRDAVGYVTQVPQVTGDITVLDTDIELIALFTTGNASSSDTEFDSCEYTASGIELLVKLKDPVAGCYAVGAVLKTVRIPEITITSEGHTSNVGGNVTQTFGFRSNDGDCIIYSGEYTP